ncbi:MAG: hypothetical protein JWR63_2876 [Conexibacter sp.]|nr:hypothetical protein [Conexibacter sp.]
MTSTLTEPAPRMAAVPEASVRLPRLNVIVSRPPAGTVAFSDRPRRSVAAFNVEGSVILKDLVEGGCAAATATATAGGVVPRHPLAVAAQRAALEARPDRDLAARVKQAVQVLEVG